MIRLYTSTTGKVHLVQGGYLSCNQAMGKVDTGAWGTRDNLTCLNCKWKLSK